MTHYPSRDWLKYDEGADIPDRQEVARMNAELAAKDARIAELEAALVRLATSLQNVENTLKEILRESDQEEAE